MRTYPMVLPWVHETHLPVHSWCNDFPVSLLYPPSPFLSLARALSISLSPSPAGATCIFSLVCALVLGYLDKRAERILNKEQGATGELTRQSVTASDVCPNQSWTTQDNGIDWDDGHYLCAMVIMSTVFWQCWCEVVEGRFLLSPLAYLILPWWI